MFLLDTHALIWALYNSDNLSEKSKEALIYGECCVSIASLWEMTIKISLGKLGIKQSMQEISSACQHYGIQIIGISPKHCDTLRNLPLIHKDPFDRILIAQAKAEGYTIVTKDEYIVQYDVKTIW